MIFFGNFCYSVIYDLLLVKAIILSLFIHLIHTIEKSITTLSQITVLLPALWQS
jgi:hypothetical protein